MSSRIIHFRNYHYEFDPENYLREYVMLYVSWRNEHILNIDLEFFFLDNEDKIKETKKKFHALDDKMLNTALEATKSSGDDDENNEHIENRDACI